MKHNIEENNAEKRMQDTEKIEYTDHQNSEIEYGLNLDKFPSEFRKNILKAMDKRFFLILLASVIVNIAVIFILRDMFPLHVDSKTITKIQEQYAKLLLDEDRQVTPVRTTEGLSVRDKLDTGVITGLNKWMDAFTEDIIESIADLPGPEESSEAEDPKETKVPTREDRGTTRESIAKLREMSREDLEKEMSSVGLLGLIARKGNAVDYEYVEDLLEYANENSDHLANVLSKLNRIEVPRYGRSQYLKRFDRKTGTDDLAELKRGRVSADEEVKKIIRNVEPLEPAKTKPIARNVQYEDVPSSYLSKLSRSKGDGKKRSAKDVVRVVQSHKRALQDCYKQELKYNPEIKGKIIVRFVINPDGIVTSASIISSTLKSPRMESCIINRVRRWRDFPPCDPSFGDKTYRQTFSFGGK